MTQRILVMGSVNADHVLQVNQFPTPGETITGFSYQIISGGKGANQAVACARLGGDTAFLACVGEDGFGSQVIEQFKADGIDTSAVEQIAGVNTGVALIFVDSKAENCIGIAAEANNHVDVACVTRHEAAIKSADFLLMQLETPIEGILRAAQIAKANGTIVALNPAPVRPLFDELLACVDIITPNQTETQALTGVQVENEADARTAAAVLHGKGIRTVVITMGRQGAFVSVQNGADQFDAMVAGFSVAAVDTTAAGDTFNGGLLIALSEGKSLIEAAQFANRCGALSVMRHGAQTSIPSRADVDSYDFSKAGQ